MGAFGPLHWIVVAIIAVLVLGGGRFSNLMGDVAKGVKNFKKGMAEEEHESSRPAPRIEAQSAARPAFEPDSDRSADRVADRPRDDR